MKHLTKQEKSPIYLQLYRRMREEIVAGNYPYHTKLPSKRSMAEQLGVSTVTVEHAYALLCEEGYVEARERSGFVVIFRGTDGFLAPMERREARTCDEAEGILSDFPLSVFSRTVRRVLSERGELLLEKSPGCGLLELREAISRYLARNRGMHVSSEQIVIGAGSEYLYGLIVELLGRERVYAIESPSYQKIEQVYRAQGVIFDPLKLTNAGIDSAALAATRASVLHTTPYRSYPSGVSASASKRHEYIRWAQADERYIIEDDFESEFSLSAKPRETLFSLSQEDNVIYLNTFSKTVSSSLRVGYMVLPKRLIQAFREKLGFYSCTVPTFVQYVLAELLSQGDFERHVNRVRRSLRRQENVQKETQ